MKNKNKHISISVGIPAYNEENNIANLLNSLLKQYQDNFIISEIIVICDASTDNTYEIVRDLQKTDKKIKLVYGNSQKGKYSRVNELFHIFRSDYLVVLDADIALVGNNFIKKLIQPFFKDPSSKMIASNTILIRPKDFIGKLLHTHYSLWIINIPQSNKNIHNFNNFLGPATAYEKSFARSIRIPKRVTEPHLYIYLRAGQMKGFRFNNKASVLQHAPSTISDFKVNARRSLGKRDELLEKIFGTQLIDETIMNPRDAKLKGLIKCFKSQPFYTILALMFSFYIRIFMRKDLSQKKMIWDSVASSKKSIGLNILI